MVSYRKFSKNIRKMNLQPILNKNSPQAYAKLGFDMLGVAKKLVKYVVHLFKIIKTKRKVFSFSQGA
jgi:hypothetical protein